MQAFRRHLAESGSAFASVARNRDLRLLSGALAGSCVGHWAYAVAVSVYAYHAGGAGAVGFVWLLRMVPPRSSRRSRRCSGTGTRGRRCSWSPT